MRDDDDQLRSYMPLLRRIIILVAVLTAVPVILWTITAYVRSYVGPPELPTYRPLAATASIQAPESTASSQDAGAQPPVAAQPPAPSDPLPVIVQARAATTDALGQSPAANGPLFGDRMTAGDAKAPASAPTIADVTPAAPRDTDAKPTATLADPAPPDGAAQSTGTLAAQQPPAAGAPPADTMPAAKRLTGPIPLPRHRPHDLVMAQMGAPQTAVTQTGVAHTGVPTGVSMGVPMPRPRPDSASPAAPETTATPGPLDWLQGIFQQHQ